MAVLEILEFPDPRLRTVAKPVENVDDRIRKIIDDMFDTMYEAPGIGLAASQVDIHEQIVVIDVSEDRSEPLVFINPEITVLDEEIFQYDEGCLSVPGFYETVERPRHVRVKALDRNGDVFEIEPEGLLAVCIQHENDHLLGKLFVDYLSPLKRNRIRGKLEKQHKRKAQETAVAATSQKLVFAGTPEFAAQHLKALLDDGHHDIVAVYTQPDRPAGRGKKPRPSPVKQLAEQAGISVYQPLNFKDQADRDALAALGADLMIVVAYGLILPQAVLDIPRLGCVNVHASLLPRWRGAAPIQRAIEAGDSETGVTIMQMAAGLDTGDMLRKVHCDIGPHDTSASLHNRLAEMGGPALIDAINQLASGTAQPEVQDDALSNYAAKIDKQEGEINWQRSAAEIDRQIRAFIPFPVCYTSIGEDRLRVWQAEPTRGEGSPGEILSCDKHGIVVACGEGALRLLSLQLPNARQMSVADVLNGHAARFSVGTVLGAA